MTPFDPRHAALVELCPTGGLIVDVGADHAAIARRVGALAIEREPQRRAGPAPAWLIADGLQALRRVDTAVIAGMGARRIHAILAAGPAPTTVIAQAEDDPAWLRVELAAAGWRLDTERLVRVPRGFAEIGRWVRGAEPHHGLTLAYGPHLLAERPEPLRDHLLARRAWWQAVADHTRSARPERAAEADAHVAFLDAHLASLPPAPGSPPRSERLSRGC
jgi:tRNA A22 N-methylase